MTFTGAVVQVVQETLGAQASFGEIEFTIGSIILLGLVVWGGKKLYDAMKPKK